MAGTATSTDCTLNCIKWLHSMQTLCVVSSGSPPLMRMPFRAPTPVPTITAVGVARHRAQGHTISSNVIAHTNALLISKQGLMVSCVKCEELVLR